MKSLNAMLQEGRVLVRSRIIRAYVFELGADVVRYRGALAFERTVDTTAAGYALPGSVGQFAGQPGTSYPEVAASTQSTPAQRLIA